MVLAAGRGDRMRPLTDVCPKPLLAVRGQPLLFYPLQALSRAGVRTVLINTGWLGDQIEATLGSQFPPPGAAHSAMPVNPLQLLYSHEGRGAGEALETAGGIVRALPQLDEAFWVAAGDVFAPDFVFSAEVYAAFKARDALAHLWLVPNPAHHPQGDFGLSDNGLALNLAPTPPSSTYTFSTVALYKRAFFQAPWCNIPPGNPQNVKAPLAPMLRAAIAQGLVSASIYRGPWVDVGTPERLAQLNL